MKHCIFACLWLCLALTGLNASEVQPLPPGNSKIEVKYMLPEIAQMPSRILDALKTGREHPDILKRGFVVQEYLAVTKKNIFKIFKSLEESGIPFGTEADLEEFLFPGRTQEIRLMRKSIKEQGSVKEIYQIGISGPGAISCLRLETPEKIDEVQMRKIKELFDFFRPEINYMIRKVYFEILAKDPNGNLIFASDGSVRTVEIDAFLSNIDGKLIPVFIDAEIKFREEDRIQALKLASEFRHNNPIHPSYFGLDATDQKKIKARNIALTGLSASTLQAFEESKFANQIHISKIINEFKRWACPTITSLVCEPLNSPLGTYLDKKVLLNAEAFGFGPTAAIAEIFPYLRDRVSHLSYIGTAHTLNLQGKLPYDQVYDHGAPYPYARKENFIRFAKDYDIFVTASDYEAAEWAKSLGMKLIIYDPLTWYWSHLPSIIHEADFYVAQNFFGVSERFKKEPDFFPDHSIVPAIVSDMYDPGVMSGQTTLLVNLGGLSNPYLKNEDLAAYAKIVCSTIREILEPEFQDVHYATSQSIANAIQDVCPAKTLQPHQVQKILTSADLAFMTSGLGNIYEASAMHKYIVWLPPANDSQGQQMALLKQHQMMDFGIDWTDIFEGEKIDYFAPQENVLQHIAALMQRLSSDSQAQEKFRYVVTNAYAEAKARRGLQPNLAELANTFETGGSKQAAESILQWIREQNSVCHESRD